MIFNSFEFLLFFPIVTTLYFILPHAFRWGLLLLASCIFYMFFVPEYILILLITILIDFFAGIYIEKFPSPRTKKLFLVTSIVCTCLVLFVFKYFNFFNDNVILLAKAIHWNYSIESLKILLPIGLSFHTFQSLSYVIEVFRGNQKAEKHFGIYSLYVMFYPQLVAGPIERPQNILHQFYERHSFDYSNVVHGLKQMLWGYFKKVVVADRLSIYVDAVYNNQEHHNGTSLILATVFFAFQIYCDFSGYSDIAIGSARVMGFKLMTNFNRPYFAKTISEFWKRWHISLTTWFKDYVYIPLGGNRVIKPLIYFNLMITFLLSGFWHGANWTYIIWGALNGIYLVMGMIFFVVKRNVKSVLERLRLARFNTFLNIFTTFLLISIAWVFFRANSFDEACSILKKMLFNHGQLFIGNNKDLIYGFVFLFILLLSEAFEEYKIFGNFSLLNNRKSGIRYLTYLTIISCILLFGVFDGSQFIYFQF